MKLLVGLGNPGQEYDGTRHNAGAMALERFRQRHGEAFGSWKERFRSRVAEGRIGEEKVVLLLPQTFMNRSGLAVQEAAAFWKVTPTDTLIVSDDITLPLGSLRLRRQGTPGGHNGLKSIFESLGTDEIPRLRLGVGNPEIYRIPAEKFVLEKFRQEETDDLEKMLVQATEALNLLLEQGLEETMNRFN